MSKPYMKKLAQARSAIDALVIALMPPVPDAANVLRLAREAYSPLELLSCKEAAYRRDREELGRPVSGSGSIDCAKCFGTGAFHTCVLFQADAARAVLTQLAEPVAPDVADPRKLRGLDSIAAMLHGPYVQAARRGERGEWLWKQWGDKGFHESVGHVAHDVVDQFAKGAVDFADALSRYIAGRELYESSNQGHGRLSPWASHHVREARGCAYMLCGFYAEVDDERGIPDRTGTARKHVGRAWRALAAIPHERAALRARRQYADQLAKSRSPCERCRGTGDVDGKGPCTACGGSCVRGVRAGDVTWIAADAADAAVIAIGWDGTPVVASGDGPLRRLVAAPTPTPAPAPTQAITPEPTTSPAK